MAGVIQPGNFSEAPLSSVRPRFMVGACGVLFLLGVPLLGVPLPGVPLLGVALPGVIRPGT